MTVSSRPYVFQAELDPARVVSTANLSANYFNGMTNNGVGATLTSTVAAALVIDSVTLNVGDPVLLTGQTSGLQNGLYFVLSAGSLSSSWVLQRRLDFQNTEQLKAGQYVPISAGTLLGGSIFVFVEPLPSQIGFSNLVFINSSSTTIGSLGTAASKAASNNAFPSVSSVNGATVVGHYPVFSDTNGTIRDSGVFLHASTAAIGGGSSTYMFADPLINPGSQVTGNLVNFTNPVSLVSIMPGSGNLTVTFTGDPGVSTFCLQAFSAGV